jgi:hypothetical protein
VPAVDPRQEILADVSSEPGDGNIDLRGMAVDLRDASPVDHVVVRLDNKVDLAVRTVPRPDVLCDMEGTLLQTGFETTVPTSVVRPGPHEVAVFVKTSWTGGLIDTGARAHFDVR